MPKKMSGENSKAVAARERKNEKATADKAAKDRAAEDAKWADNDKGLAKKQVWVLCNIRKRTNLVEVSPGKMMLRRKGWKLLPRRKRGKTC